MKTFFGKWRFGPTGTLSWYMDLSDMFVFYSVDAKTVVIQSEDTNKYLELKSLPKKPPERGASFTAFTATTEFDSAYHFTWLDGHLDTGPPAGFAGTSGCQLCLLFDRSKTERVPLHWNVRVAPQAYQLGFLTFERDLDYSIEDLYVDDQHRVVELIPVRHHRVTPPLAEIRLHPPVAHWFDEPWIDLSNVDLSGEDCSGLVLKKADLRGSNLAHANMNGLVLTDAYLEGADFSYVDLTNTKYDTKYGSPPSVVGREGKLTSFRNATVPASLLGKDWSYVDLSGATITGLSGTDLRGLKAVGANLSRVDLTGSTLDNADFTKSTIIKAYFIECTLIKPIFREALLYGTAFTSSIIEGGDFRSAQLGRVDDEKPQASFSYTYLFNADFRSSNLYRVNFFGVSMFGAETNLGDEAILDNVVMTNSYLAEIKFENLKMRGADLSNSCLVNANFTGSDLSELNGPTKLISACLHGANFSDAHLGGADLTDAAISFDHGELPVRYYDEKRELHYQINKHYQKTSGLDKTEGLPPTMVCPNRKRIEDNRRENVGWREMMSCKDAPKEWLPPPRI